MALSVKLLGPHRLLGMLLLGLLCCSAILFQPPPDYPRVTPWEHGVFNLLFIIKATWFRVLWQGVEQLLNLRYEAMDGIRTKRLQEVVNVGEPIVHRQEGQIA
jgi:hypothetical protein